MKLEWEKDENKRKRGQDWPIINKVLIYISDGKRRCLQNILWRYENEIGENRREGSNDDDDDDDNALKS